MARALKTPKLPSPARRADAPGFDAAPGATRDLLHASCFRRLVDCAPHFGLFLVDHDGRIQSWNPGAQELTGYTMEEILGQPLHQIVKIEADHRFQYDEALWRASQCDDEHWEGERFIARKDGSFLSGVTTVTPIRDQGRNLMGYAVTLRSNLESGEAERSLRDSLTLLKTIIETLPDPIFVKDRDGCYLLVNSAFTRHFAGTRSETGVLGKTAQDLFSRTQAALLQHADEIAMEGVETAEVELALGRAPEQYFYAVTEMSFRNAAGHICGVIGVAREITALREQEREREILFTRETEARYEAERTVHWLAAVQTICDTALAHLQPSALIAELLDRVCRVLNADTATLYMAAPDGKVLDRCQSVGNRHEEEMFQPILLGQGLIGQIAKTRAPAIVADRRLHETGTLFDDPKTIAFIGVPLVLDNILLGVLHLGSATPGHFCEADLNFLDLVSERIATALERGRLFEELQFANEALHRLSQRMIEAQEEERRHISRELHDEVGQILTGIKLHLKSIASGSDGELLKAKLSEACEHVDEAIGQVRRLSAGLRPASLDTLGLVPALHEYVDRIAFRAGLLAEFRADDLQQLSKDLEITIFRIAQEAIANSVRHARANCLEVELHRTQNEILLIVRDDGLGFETALSRRRAEMGLTFGLKSMEERALLLGGWLEIESRPGEGCVLRAGFPFQTSA